MSRSHSSWGEGVSSPRVGVSARRRGLPPPSPLYVFQYCVWCVAFAFENSLQFGTGTRPLVMDTLAEMPEAEKCMCLTHPPVRAQNRREEKRDGGLPRF